MERASQRPRGTHLVVVDVSGPRPAVVARRPLPPDSFAADFAWWNDRRLVATTGIEQAEHATVFTASLDPIARFRWRGQSPVVAGGVLYALDYGELLAARLPNGPVRVLRRYQSPETYVLATLREPIRLVRRASL
jgi:hypothetical protein